MGPGFHSWNHLLGLRHSDSKGSCKCEFVPPESYTLTRLLSLGESNEETRFRVGKFSMRAVGSILKFGIEYTS